MTRRGRLGGGDTLTFCCEIIDVVKDIATLCLKPQSGVFEPARTVRMVALAEVIAHASDAGLIVITDGKRNDIGRYRDSLRGRLFGQSSSWKKRLADASVRFGAGQSRTVCRSL